MKSIHRIYNSITLAVSLFKDIIYEIVSYYLSIFRMIVKKYGNHLQVNSRIILHSFTKSTKTHFDLYI